LIFTLARLDPSRASLTRRLRELETSGISFQVMRGGDVLMLANPYPSLGLL
jgi:hypothetical protein